HPESCARPTSLAPPSTSPGKARKGHDSWVVLPLLNRPGLPWNGGPACRGIPARHHVESWPGMAWNLQPHTNKNRNASVAIPLPILLFPLEFDFTSEVQRSPRDGMRPDPSP